MKFFKFTFQAEMDDSNSDCELVIDETIVVSSDEDDLEPLEPKKNLFDGNIFHPISISASDIKEELFHEDTNTCSICNESFRYNVGLIYHLEMEHMELKIASKQSKPKKRKGRVKKKNEPQKSKNHIGKEKANKVLKQIPTGQLIQIAELNNKNLKIAAPIVERKMCGICKKYFTDQIKLAKHVESCSKTGIKFHCKYCKSQFGWESKYKKHLFRTHKLNAAVICKLCSDVFADMGELASHSKVCRNRSPKKDGT